MALNNQEKAKFSCHLRREELATRASAIGDLLRGILHVQSDHPPKAGERVQLEVIIEDLPAQQAEVLVIWSRPSSPQKPAGFGAKLLVSEPALMLGLESLATELSQSSADENAPTHSLMSPESGFQTGDSSFIRPGDHLLPQNLEKERSRISSRRNITDPAFADAFEYLSHTQPEELSAPQEKSDGHFPKTATPERTPFVRRVIRVNHPTKAESTPSPVPAETGPLGPDGMPAFFHTGEYDLGFDPDTEALLPSLDFSEAELIDKPAEIGKTLGPDFRLPAQVDAESSEPPRHAQIDWPDSPPVPADANEPAEPPERSSKAPQESEFESSSAAGWGLSESSGFESSEKSEFEVSEESGSELSEKIGLEFSKESGSEVFEESGLEFSEESGLEVSEESGLEVSEKSGLEVSEESGLEVLGDSGLEVSEKFRLEFSEGSGLELAGESELEVSEESGLEVLEESRLEHSEESELEVLEEPGLEHSEESGLEVLEESGLEVLEEPGLEHSEESGLELSEESGLEVLEESRLEHSEKSGLEILEEPGLEVSEDSRFELTENSGVEVPENSSWEFSEDSEWDSLENVGLESQEMLVIDVSSPELFLEEYSNWLEHGLLRVASEEPAPAGETRQAILLLPAEEGELLTTIAIQRDLNQEESAGQGWLAKIIDPDGEAADRLGTAAFQVM